MPLSQAKMLAIEHIENDIASRSKRPNSIELQMSIALQNVTNTIRTNPRARLGCGYNNSNNNLSYVLSKAVNPVLDRIKFPNGTPISEYFTCFNSTSKPNDIEHAERIIKAIYLTADEDGRVALDMLDTALMMLRNHFSPNQKRVKKSDDGFYCRYCYREARLSFDTCEDHKGLGRADGKRKSNRYNDLKLKIMKARQSEDITNTFMLQQLKTIGVSPWNGDPSNSKWIETLITAIRACELNENRIKSLTVELTEASKKLHNPVGHQDWPTALNGTMFRYEICKLMNFRVPHKELAKRLKRIWEGESVTQVAKSCIVKREPLQRKKTFWSKRVDEMRKAGIADSIIKIVLGFEVLPP